MKSGRGRGRERKRGRVGERWSAGDGRKERKSGRESWRGRKKSGR